MSSSAYSTPQTTRTLKPSSSRTRDHSMTGSPSSSSQRSMSTTPISRQAVLAKTGGDLSTAVDFLVERNNQYAAELERKLSLISKLTLAYKTAERENQAHQAREREQRKEKEAPASVSGARSPKRATSVPSLGPDQAKDSPGDRHREVMHRQMSDDATTMHSLSTSRLTPSARIDTGALQPSASLGRDNFSPGGSGARLPTGQRSTSPTSPDAGPSNKPMAIPPRGASLQRSPSPISDPDRGPSPTTSYPTTAPLAPRRNQSPLHPPPLDGVVATLESTQFPQTPPQRASSPLQHAPRQTAQTTPRTHQTPTGARPPPTTTRSPPTTNVIPPTPAAVQTSTMGRSPQPATSLMAEPSSRQLSRESRISLPDEAKQYIANMQDSPVPSPRFNGAFASSSAPSVAKSRSNTLDTLRESEVSEPQLSANQGQKRSNDVSPKSASPFLEMDDDDDATTAETSSPLPASAISATTSTADQFPLPPVTDPRDLAQAQAAAQAQGRTHISPQSTPTQTAFGQSSDTYPARFLALALTAPDIPYTSAVVDGSHIRANDRGKEVLTFMITVTIKGKGPWSVNKLYSDVLALDGRIRSQIGRSLSKKLAPVPDAKLFKDNAPAKADQRKSMLAKYLQSVLELPVKNKDEICAFLSTDIMREQAPVAQSGYKEGYLTKRGKNFGGWRTRYFVLEGSTIEYYENRGGNHLGTINLVAAQIGRQQRTDDDDSDFRHAFLIMEQKRGPAGTMHKHVLCAESDQERDAWVEVLVQSLHTHGDENEAFTNTLYSESTTTLQPRPSTSSLDIQYGGTPVKRDRIRTNDISVGAAMPISQLPLDKQNDKLLQTAPPLDTSKLSSTPSKHHMSPSPVERGGSAAHSIDIPVNNARRILERGMGHSPANSGSTNHDTMLSSSLPSNSPLDSVSSPSTTLRPSSELGHYADNAAEGSSRAHHERAQRSSLHPSKASSRERPPSPNLPVASSASTSKISGPMNGAPIPPGYNFGAKEPSPIETYNSERERKAKSGRFWGFGRGNSDKPMAEKPRAVFGVSIEESLKVAEISLLPAVVFRCIQYLEANDAELEEGIYRLSGSSAVIKGLKDRFNAESDVDLLSGDDYWDPHAIAGLLKTYLRELPGNVLPSHLYEQFVNITADTSMDAGARIAELKRLVRLLPLANYSLLRALFGHLIRIVENCATNKMTLKNIGIVFSPTLQVPPTVFSLMMMEFQNVFDVEEGDEEPEEGEEVQDEEMADTAAEDQALDPEGTPRRSGDRRNSRRYSEGAADRLLGLSGRSLPQGIEENDSSDVGEEGGGGTTEENADASESDAHTPNRPLTSSSTAASHPVAAARGLQVGTSARSERRVSGLPSSPRPHHAHGAAPSPRTPTR